jgi:hypothetical protein
LIRDFDCSRNKDGKDKSGESYRKAAHGRIRRDQISGNTTGGNYGKKQNGRELVSFHGCRGNCIEELTAELGLL